jgi:exopolysaccharide production protein ExoZ
MNVQALRGVAILMVVLRHMKVYEGRYGPAHLLPDFAKIGDAGVDLFFAISGFVMVATTLKSFAVPGAVSRFLYKRVTRIYPLYWVFSLVIVPLYLTHPGMVNSSDQGVPISLPASFLLWPQRTMPLLGQGWTLIHEIYFYAVFSLFLFVPRHWITRLLGLWSVLLAIAGAVTFSHPNLLEVPIWKLIASPLTFEFVGGCVIALLFYKGKSAWGWQALLAGIVLMVLGWYMDPIDPDPSLRRRAILYGVPSILLLYGALSLEKHSRFIFPKQLLYLGDISYSVYLTHIFVLASLGRLWARVGHGGSGETLFWLVLMAASTVTAGALSHRYLEMPILEFFQTQAPRLFRGARERVHLHAMAAAHGERN